MTDRGTQAQIILDSFMNRFDADCDDEVTAVEIERRLDEEGVDAPTARAVAGHAMSNWDESGSGTLTPEELARFARTWSAFKGDVSRSAFSLDAEGGGDGAGANPS